MQKYRDAGGNSGIEAFEFSDDGITIVFKNGSTYVYSNESAGADHIAEMKRLALAGQGLNTYLNLHVHEKFVGAVKAPTPPSAPARIQKGPFRTR